MNYIQLILASALTTLLIGCATSKPSKKYKFSRTPFTLQQPTRLRTDGVYLYHYWNQYIKKNAYTFTRFYNDGRCYYQGYLEGDTSTHLFSKTDIESAPFGERCFYRNRGDTIIIERWETYGRFSFTKVILQGDTLIDAGYTNSRHSKKYNPSLNDSRYVFVPVIFDDSTKW